MLRPGRGKRRSKTWVITRSFSDGGDKGYFYSLLPSFPHITFPSPSSSFSCPERRYQLSSDLFYFTPPFHFPPLLSDLFPPTPKKAQLSEIGESNLRAIEVARFPIFLLDSFHIDFFSCDLLSVFPFCCFFAGT